MDRPKPRQRHDAHARRRRPRLETARLAPGILCALCLGSRRKCFQPTPVPLQKSSAFATTSLILGVVSLTAGLCCCYGLPFNVTGLVFSIIALGQIKSNPDRYTGTGMAITGLILCSLSLVLMTILMIIALLTSGLGHTTHHGYRL